MQRLFHGELYNKKGSDSGISLSEPIIFYKNTSVLSIIPLFGPFFLPSRLQPSPLYLRSLFLSHSGTPRLGRQSNR